MNRKPTAIAAVAVLGIGGLLLAGCAPVNTTKATPTAQLPLVGWKNVPASSVTQGGTLNLAVLQSGTDGGNWNINTAEGNEQDVINILAPTTGGPYKATAAGGVEVDPNYATSITLTSKSPETIDVKLNPKAVWQDGTPITATDYQATFAALSGTNAAYDIASSQGFSDVDSFNVVSPTEFNFTFKTVYADWQGLLTDSPVQAAIANDPKKWSKGFVTAPMPSDGPYIVSKVDNPGETFTETPNPKWWGDKPKLDTITWKVIDQSAQGQAFVNGEISAVDAQDVDTYDAATKLAGSVKESSGGTTWSQVTFNGKATPLNDVKVRKAISQAIDRTIISKAANSPLGVEATTDGNWIFMPGQKGYTDTVSSKIPFDASASKKLLTSDGWKLKGGKWTKKGKTLSLSIIYPQGTASNELRAQQIQASLKKIDIAVTLQQVPSADYFTDIIDGKYEMATFGWGGTLFPISAAEALFYPAQKYGDQSGSNFAFITNPKLKTLFDKADSDLNSTTRLKYAQQINEVIAGYIPMLPIYPYPNVTIVDKGLANYGPATFAATDWTTVGFTS
jgi:peptide/nickel transport system substrate-binding protein